MLWGALGAYVYFWASWASWAFWAYFLAYPYQMFAIQAGSRNLHRRAFRSWARLGKPFQTFHQMFPMLAACKTGHIYAVPKRKVHYCYVALHLEVLLIGEKICIHTLPSRCMEGRRHHAITLCWLTMPTHQSVMSSAAPSSSSALQDEPIQLLKDELRDCKSCGTTW